MYQGANALFVVQQWRDGADPKRPVWQRLAGTVVELAVDYVKVDPGLFGGSGKGDRVVHSFLPPLDNVEFAEARHDELLVEILQACLNTFAGQVELVVGDATLALLMKRVSTPWRTRWTGPKKPMTPARFSPCKTSAGQRFRTFCGFPPPLSRSKPPASWGPRIARKSSS